MTRKAKPPLILRVPQPIIANKLLEPMPGMTPAVFGQAMYGKNGGHVRARSLSRRRRQEIASKAARTRWHGQETTCKAEPADDRRVTCDDCGLSWTMGDPNYPACPRLSTLQVMPPIDQLEERARDICFRMVHGGNRTDFDDYLGKRPDWQAMVNYIVLQLMEVCSR